MIHEITVGHGWTRYKQDVRIEPGQYYKLDGKPSDLMKRQLALMAVSDPSGRFHWITPVAEWIRHVLLGQFIKETTTYGKRQLTEADRELFGGFDLGILRPWQARFLADAISALESGFQYRRGAIVSLGGGKTLEGLLLGTLGERCAVLAPRHTHDTWRRDASKWGLPCPIVSTYESAHRLDPVDVLLLDECFFKETQVLMADGSYRRINEINPGDSVMGSLDGAVYEPHKVKGILTKKLSQRIVKIVHEFGEVICTENHPIWTKEAGYIEAKYARNKTVRVVRSSFSSNSTERKKGEKVLRDIMLRKVADDAALGKSKFQEGDKNSSGEIVFHDFGRKSHESEVTRNSRNEALRRNSKKIILENEGQTHIVEGWKWERTHPLGIEDTGRSVSSRTDFGVELDYSDTLQVETRVHGPDALQNRCSYTGIENSNRGRREQSQQSNKTGTGSQEDRNLTDSRVVCVEIQESRDFRGLAGIPYVYCLSVEDSESFIADGVLVHNCLLLKNPDTLRAEKARHLSEKASIVVALTGTPTSAAGPLDWRWLDCVRPGCVPRNEIPWRFLFSEATTVKEVTPGRKAYVTPASSWLTERIANYVSPFLMRVDTSELLAHLPPVTYTRLTTPRPKDWDVVVKGAATAKGASKRVTQARMLSDGFVMDDDGNVIRLDTAKIDAAAQLVEGAGEPVVIFAAWRETIRALAEKLNEYKPAVVSGDTADIGFEIGRFLSGDTDVLIINSRAGSGIDGLQDRSRIGIFVSNSTSPVDRVQAEGRLFRSGQNRGVQIVDVVAEGTLDERHLELLKSHNDLSSSMVEKILLEAL